MLTQEELDKLLNEEGGDDSGSKGTEPKQQATASEEAGDANTLSQEDLDELMDGGDSQPGSEQSAEGQKEDQDIDWSDAFKEAAEGGDSAAAKAVQEGAVSETEAAPEPQATVNQPEFGELKQEHQDPDSVRPELDFLLEIPLDISVELGRRSLKIKELLQLSQGSVVELNKMAGEPADIYVNKKLMAKGEVVVVNEKFGIKLTEIISPAERVKSLG